MNHRTKNLFTTTEIFRYQEQTRKEVFRRVDSLSSDILHSKESNLLAKDILSSKTLIIPQLQKDKTEVKQVEVAFSRSNEHRFFGDFHGERSGTYKAVDFYCPFEGSMECFDIQPSSFHMNAITGYVESGFLVIQIPLGTSAEEVRTKFSATIGRVEEYLRTLTSDFRNFYDVLLPEITSRINSRKQVESVEKSIIRDLGFPERG
jgi:hypothetical protein